MATALGIYIGNNIIKYSKVTETKGRYKIEAFGTKYTENVSETLKQIIEETNCKKRPIVVNAIDEEYNYFEVFAKLNRSDYEKSIEMQFEEIMSDRSINKNLMKTGYLISEDVTNLEKLHVLHVSQYITATESRANKFGGNVPDNFMPTTISVTNLVKNPGTYAILNLEEELTITGVTRGNAYEVKKLGNHLATAIKEINRAENSIANTYEVLKNTIIPLSEVDNMNVDEGMSVPIIVKAMTDTIADVKEYLASTNLNIKKLYITGTGATISNVEMLFSSQLKDIDVEVLNPFFINEKQKTVPIKEYVDVNSATALALEKLGFEKRTMAFRADGQAKKEAASTLNMDIKDIDFRMLGENIKESFKVKLQAIEKIYIRLIFVAILILIIFGIVSTYLEEAHKKKMAEVEVIRNETLATINKTAEDKEQIANKDMELQSEIANINKAINKANGKSSDYIKKDLLPNFLNQLAHIIPVRAKVTKITEVNSHITMTVESEKYEQIGYFTGLLDSEGILLRIKTSESHKEGNVVKVTIEGDLP